MITAMAGQKNPDRFAKFREQMLRWNLRGRDIVDPGVLAAMEEVPREEFVPQSHRSQSYSDGPLPIGMGQTISQPYIVALMTQELIPDCNTQQAGKKSLYDRKIQRTVGVRSGSIRQVKHQKH